MSIGNTRFRHKFAQRLGKDIHCFDNIVNNVDLSAPCKLFHDCLAHKSIIVFNNKSLHGITRFRRGFNNAHIAYAAHAHVQSARNRGCRKGQNIYISLQIFYLFLMIDTEPLFLIDDQEPQILEFYIF